MKTFTYWLSALFVMLASSAAAMGQATTRPNVPDRGIKPVGAYSVSDVENISLTNGNVNLSIPLASLPPIAGGKLSWALRAEYNSKLWDFAALNQLPDQLHSSPWVINLIQQSITGGWRIGGKYSIREDRLGFHFSGALPPCAVPDCSDAAYIYRLFLTTPDGTEHELRTTDFQSFPTAQIVGATFRNGYFKDTPATRQTRARYYSADGSYLFATIEPYPADSFLATPQNWTIYMPDGTRVKQLNGVQTIIDNDQNSITIATTTNSNGVITTSFVGAGVTQRQIQYVFDPNGGGGAGHGQVIYQGVTGQQEIIDINFGSTSLNGLVYNLDDQSCQDMSTPMGFQTIHEVQSIQYPASDLGPRLQYSFNYNSDSAGPDFDYHRQCTTDLTHVVAPAKGWGSLSHMVTPSGATVDYSYSLDNNGALVCCDPSKRPPVETITKKVLTHDGTSDTWTYNINYTTPETLGNDLTRVSTVIGPDGSSTQESFYSAGSATNGGLQSLVFKTVQSSSSTQTITERRWALNSRFAGADAGSNLLDPSGTIVFNPIAQTEYVTVTGSASKMSGKTFQYDVNGNVLQETDYDWVTLDPNLARDSQGVPTAPPTGAVLRQINNTYYNGGATYALRDTGGLPRILNALQENSVSLGSVQFSDTQLSYDNLAFGSPPTNGHVTSRADKIDATHTATTQLSYDSLGNLLSTTDPNSNITTYLYSDPTLGLPTSVIVDPKNGTGQQTTNIAYDQSTGLVTSITDANQKTTSTLFTNQVLGGPDPFGRPGLVTDPLGRQTVTRYFDNARQTEVWSDLNSPGDALIKSRASHDRLGRVVRNESSEDGASYTIFADSVYQQMGRITIATNPMREPSAGTDGWARTTRDETGRVVTVETFSGRYPSGSSTGVVITSYDANTATVTDQAAKPHRSLKDALGRLIRVDEPDMSGNLGTVAAPTQPTSYTYDPLSDLTGVQQGSQPRTFTYDSLSRLRQATNPESGSIGYTYDNNGNLQTRTDARSVVTTYLYDGLNRVTSRTYSGPAPGGTTPTVTYGYDNASVSNPKGRLTSVTSSVSSYSYGGYDALGRVLTGTQTTDGQPYTTIYQYNLAGEMTTEQYPSGTGTVVTDYDSAGRIAGVRDQASSLYYAGATPTDATNRMQYAAHGAVTAMKLRNGLVEKTGFNGRLQPTQITLGTTANPSSVLELDYDFGPTGSNNGNLMSQRIIAGGLPAMDVTQNYTYDWLNRLSTATEVATTGGAQQWQQIYDCDRYGNRAVRTTSYIPQPLLTPQSANATDFSAFNQANNQIRRANFGYDAAGNLTADPTTGPSAMIYDADNHMTSYTKAGITTSYSYDGAGQRVKKSDSTGTVVYVYNASGQLLVEYTTGTPAGNGISYLTSDHLGSTRVVTKSDGTVRARYDYLPFGEELSAGVGQRSTAMGYSGSDDTRQKFTSKERDNESGLDYFLARYYASAQGRFTSTDDFIKDSHTNDPQSWNKYVYVRNNPLKLVDPTGEDADVTIQTDEEQKKGTITIKANLALWTSKDSGLSKEDLDKAGASFKEQIEKAWSGSFERDGITYTVTTEVSVRTFESEEGAKGSGDRNIIQVTKGPASPPGLLDRGADSETWHGFAADWGLDKGAWNNKSRFSAHEFGHLLGLGDREKGPELMNQHNTSATQKALNNDYEWAFGATIGGLRDSSRPMISTGVLLPGNPSSTWASGAPQSRTMTTRMRVALLWPK